MPATSPAEVCRELSDGPVDGVVDYFCSLNDSFSKVLKEMKLVE